MRAYFGLMKIQNRLFALTALLGASTLALTGCVIPFGGGDNDQTDDNQTETQVEDNQTDDGQTDDGQTDDNQSDDAGDVDLAGTDWAGTINGDNVEIHLNVDGTVDFPVYEGFDGGLDEEGDTWSVNGDEVVFSLLFQDSAGNPTTIDFTGPLDANSLELSGQGMDISLTRA